MPPNLGSVVSQCCRRVGARSIGRPQARGFCSPPGSNGEEKAVATGFKSLGFSAKNIRVFSSWMLSGYVINFVYEMHALIKVKQRVDAKWKDLRRRA
ncbi:unnamed protein product [Arabidopsis lyrata]|nr:unnamed protein product [Arabidopsis lyrata]